MRFIVAMHTGMFTKPEVLERHEGTEADARRVLRRWLNDGDRISREVQDEFVILRIVAPTDGEPSDVFAVLRQKVK